MNSRFVFFWMAVSLAFECVGDLAIKRWSLAPGRWLPLVISFLGYNCMLLAWFLIVWKAKELSWVGTVWLLLGQVCLLGVGVGFYHESLSFKQWLGVAFACVALLLLST